MKLTFPDDLYEFSRVFQRDNWELYLVGGAVRDALRGEIGGDFDFATNAKPGVVRGLFKRTVPTGIKHGTVTVLWRDRSIEVTTYRNDGKYTDSRHPDEVQFSETIEEDLSRRDFTVNGMAYDLLADRLVDLYGGQDDLRAGILRTIGDPAARFSEDALRMMRACRFVAQLEFSLHEATEQAAGEQSDRIRHVAAERVREELMKIIMATRPSRGIEAMRTSGLLRHVLPELDKGYQMSQNRFHRYDVYYHNVYSCDAAPADPVVRLAALLHDVAKAYCSRTVDHKPEPVFYNHEVIGARIVRKIMRRLKFSTAMIEDVSHLVRHHMFHYTSEWTDGAVRRFMKNVTPEKIPQLFDLRIADHKGNGYKQGAPKSLYHLRRRIDRVIEEENAISLKDLAVDGTVLMSDLNLRPGPVIGDILDHLLEIILDYPERNTREELLAEAKRFLAEKTDDGSGGSPRGADA